MFLLYISKMPCYIRGRMLTHNKSGNTSRDVLWDFDATGPRKTQGPEVRLIFILVQAQQMMG